MNKLILCMVIGLMMFTLVSAADDQYYGKQYEDVTITETCADEGFHCDATFTCNITIVDPNQKIVVLNAAMTRNETIYNYTFTSTDVLGEYKIKTYCGNTTFSGENLDGTLDVTTTGKESSFAINIFLILVSLGLFILALYMNNHAIGFISGILFCITGMYTMIYGIGNLADLYTRSMAYTVIAFGSFVVLIAGYEWLSEVD